MDKIKPGSGHLDSSATHRVVQASTILDRRYVKRPTTTNAGKYSTASRTRSNNVAPSRLINLGVRSTDLEIAQIKESIQEEVDETNSEMDSYLTEDALALNLEIDEATTPPVEEAAIEMPDNSYDDSYNSVMVEDSSSTSFENSMNAVDQNYPSEPAVEDTSDESSPVSMYALEAMKRSMMQDLVSGNTDSFSSNTTSPSSMSSDMESVSNMSSNNPYSSSYPSSYPTSTESYYNNSPITPAEYSAAPVDSASAEPIDMISKATSDALASIRIATESSDVSDQMASLKAFADSIKSDSSSPEMAELGNTIEKFANVAMKSTKAKEEAENKVALSVSRSPRIAQSSARLNRPSATPRSTMPTTTRPTLSRSPKVASISRTPAKPASHRTAARPTSATARKTATSRRTPDNHTLEQALRSVATMDDERPSNTKTKKSRSRAKIRRKRGFARFALALGCASACIAAVVYFVGANIPDISVQVAAMQTGINAAYPSYIPRDYSLGDISSENGRLTMRFNGPNGSSFTLVEEKSSWDSSALQRNYVEPTWGENFTTTHEQGITIFLSNSDAAWVNGGILYKITSSSNDLTKKQLRNIVTSI